MQTEKNLPFTCSKLFLTSGFLLCTLAFIFPLSSAGLHNLILFSVLITFLLSKERNTLLFVYKGNLTIKLATILFIYLALSVLWNGITENTLKFLLKYREFIILGLLTAILSHKTIFKLTYKALLLGLVITLLASYLIYFDLWFWRNGEWNSLHMRIFHGLQMNILLLISLYQLLIKQKYRALSATIVLAIIINLILIEPGLTSQLSMIALLVFFAVHNLRKNKSTIKPQIIIISFFIIGFLFLAFTTTGIRVLDNQNRIQGPIHSMDEKDIRNLDIRAAWYINGFHLLYENSLTGYGLGNIREPYLQYKNNQVLNNEQDLFVSPDNVHNQFLQISLETGIVGGIFFTIFLTSILLLKNIPTSLKTGVFIITALSNLFNSSFLDHGDGWILMLVISLLIAKSGSKNSFLQLKKS